MNSFSFQNCLIVTAGLALASSAYSDRIDFRVLVGDNALLSRDLCFHNGKKGVPLENLSKVRRSDVVTYNGDGRSFLIGFLGGNPGSVKEPFMPEGEFVQVDVPDAVQEPLVVLYTENETAKTAVIEDSKERFKWGELRIHNLTEQDYVVTYGEENSLELKAGEGGQLELDEETGMFEVVVTHPDEPEQPVYSSIWSQQKNTRKLGLLMSERRGVTISVVSQNKAGH